MLKGVILSILILVGMGLVFGVGFHTANEVLPGTFNGNYNFSDNVTFSGSVSGVLGLPKAYALFDGTDGSILNSYNVNSIVKTNTGRYTVTFQNAMENTNYLVLGTASKTTSQSNPRDFNYISDTMSTSTFDIMIQDASNTYRDQDKINFIVY